MVRPLAYLSFIDLERGGFGEILPEVMIAEGNISLNPPRGGSINYILYRKLKASKLRNIKLATYIREYDVYFVINVSICHFSLESHIVWNIDNIFQNLLQKFLKKRAFLKFNLIIHHSL
jgi:hypothetical protein